MINWSNFSKYWLLIGCWAVVRIATAQQLYPVKSDNGCGFINAAGELVVDTSWSRCTQMDGYSYAKACNDEGCHLFTSNGIRITTEALDSLWHFNDDLFIAQQKNKRLLFRARKGKTEIIVQTDSLQLLPEKKKLQAWMNKSTYLIDQAGKLYFYELELTSIEVLDDQHLLVHKDDKVGIIDWEGRPYLAVQYDSLEHYEGGIRFYTDSLQGFKKELISVDPVTHEHETLFLPAIYSDIRFFGDYFIRCEREDSIISLYDIPQKKELTTSFHDQAEPFNYYYHVLEEQEKKALISRSGEELTPMVYDGFFETYDQHRVVYLRDDRYGFLNEDGEELTQPIFDRVYAFKSTGLDPRSFSKYKKDDLFGLVTKDGELLTEAVYYNIQFISDDRAACTRKDSTVEVFMIDPSTANVLGSYQLLSEKQLEIKTSMEKVDYDRLEGAVKPSPDGLFHAYAPVNVEKEGKYRYGGEFYYDIDYWLVGEGRVLQLSSLVDSTLAPMDNMFELLSVQGKGGYGYEKSITYSTHHYRNVELIDSAYFKATRLDGTIDVLNPGLYELSFRAKVPGKGTKVLYTKDLRGVNEHYYRIFTTVDSKGDTIELLLDTPDLEALPLKPIYNSLQVAEKYVMGRKDSLWEMALPDSVTIPGKNVDIDITPTHFISKQHYPFTDVYDRQGDQTMRVNHLEIVDQHSDLVLVELDSGYNYITPEGTFLLNHQVKEATPYVHGYASILVDDAYTAIDHSGRAITDTLSQMPLAYSEEGTAIVYLNRSFRLMDTQGQFLSDESYAHISRISDAKLYRVKKERGEGYGLMNLSGKKVNNALYQDIKSTGGNLLHVKNSKGDGLVSGDNGKELLKPKYDNLRYAGYGLYVVSKRGKWGVVDEKGDWVLKRKYHSIGSFNRHGFARVLSRKGKCYLLSDGTLTEDRPQKSPVVEESVEKIQDLPLISYNGYLGLSDPYISPRYDQVKQLGNGVLIARRFNRFAIGRLTNGEVLEVSGQWLDATLVGEGVVKVDRVGQISYYSLKENQWVWHRQR